jgi:alpha-L-arabinofuranosidase
MTTRISRRGFVARAALFSAMTSRKAFSFETQEQRAGLSVNIETGTIRPELHGHFAEHLGSCTYGGLWVGKNSKIPNVDGYRKQAVEYLKALGVPVLRWPGGCFADDYHWRDGIGPLEKRPKTVNLHWGNYVEDNSFGTHEFVGLCRLIGAEPYFAGNVGTGTPEELRDWVEYCNYPSGSTLSDERARNGSKEPFNIRYWGVGNENWGCGGNMRPEEYAAHYRRYSTFLRPMGDAKPFLIACGPSSNDTDWSRRLMDSIKTPRSGLPNGFAMHFYSRGKSPATKFSVEDLQDQLSSFSRMEQGIVQQRALLDGYDPDRRIGLMVDEWGVWDRILPEDEKRYGKLWQQITMRSAVAAAMGLNVFHRQAGKLYMCNIAQIVNVLHSVLLTDEDKCIRTSTYYAFDMLKAHRGKQSVHVETGDSSPLGLSLSASRRDKDLVVTFVNPKHDTAIKVNCSLTGAGAISGKARILHHSDFNACNTFENPDVIVTRDHRVDAAGTGIQTELPPLSIVTATVRLA